MKVNIVSQKLIKPCTPTPQNLNKYKLCLTDELTPPFKICIVLFYSHDDNMKQKRIQQLEESLSEILPKFYHLAGRYMKNDGFVDCSDQGAEFVVAEATADDVDFNDIVSKMDTEQIDGLIPSKSYQLDDSSTNPLLIVQITELCGGLVIGVCISHTVFDASSVGTFIAAWSNAAAANNNNSNSYSNNSPAGGGKIEIICPSFESRWLLWPEGRRNRPIDNHEVADSMPTTNTDDGINNNNNYTLKRFCFNKDGIARLRSKLISTNYNYYSRVRLVCGMIAKALIGLDMAKNGGKSRACAIFQAVNLRGRTVPPLPKHSCGNLAIFSSTRCMSEAEIDNITNNNNNNGLQELVNVIGEGLEKTVADCAEIFNPAGASGTTLIMDTFINWIRINSSGEVNTITFSDWSKFGFYEANFGWGKPVGVGIPEVPGAVKENVVLLMNNKEGGGIEAWVGLKTDDMAYFQQNQDIQLFTTA